MAYNFVACDRDQPYLLPPSLTDWLPDNHLAWFVIEAVEHIDIKPFFTKYRADGIGNTAFNLKMMAALLIYAYCKGERSSRQIEKYCETDVAYRVISANQIPDHSTISRFRKDNERHLKGLFLEILKLCAEAGLVKVGRLSLVGTKMEANASLAANRTLKHLKVEINRMLTQAAQKDAEEDKLFGKDKRGDELPEDMQNRKGRMERLKACKERLEKKEEEERKAQEEKIARYKAKEEKAQKRRRGRKPKDPDEISKKEAKANVTDPDSRIMKTREGYVQGLNAQAVVTEEQIIVAEDVTQEENDKKQLHPMIEQTESNRVAAGITEDTGVVLADAGYASDDNSRRNPAGDVELLVATRNDYKQREALQEGHSPEEPVPIGLSPTELMERKIQKNRELYRLRSQTVEPVFGQIKDIRGCDRFKRRGLAACRSEWSLVCATHNLFKLWRSRKACWN